MVLFWSSESNDSKENKGSFVPISKLSEFSGELKLHPNILFPNAAACSQDFYWKGKYRLSTLYNYPALLLTHIYHYVTV